MLVQVAVPLPDTCFDQTSRQTCCGTDSVGLADLAEEHVCMKHLL